VREDGRLVGGRKGNGSSTWEWQGIIAFCTYQWNEWMNEWTMMDRLL
jgi:hypothetical protein